MGAGAGALANSSGLSRGTSLTLLLLENETFCFRGVLSESPVEWESFVASDLGIESPCFSVCLESQLPRVLEEPSSPACCSGVFVFLASFCHGGTLGPLSSAFACFGSIFLSEVLRRTSSVMAGLPPAAGGADCAGADGPRAGTRRFRRGAGL